MRHLWIASSLMASFLFLTSTKNSIFLLYTCPHPWHACESYQLEREFKALTIALLLFSHPFLFDFLTLVGHSQTSHSPQVHGFLWTCFLWTCYSRSLKLPSFPSPPGRQLLYPSEASPTWQMLPWVWLSSHTPWEGLTLHPSGHHVPIWASSGHLHWSPINLSG